jgi:PAS domain S-box-containing protein
MEAELRAGQRIQELIMETAPVGIFRTDSEGNCAYVNTHWSDITGLTYEQSMGEGWILPIHHEDKYNVFGAWGDFITGQSQFEMRWRFQRPDQTVRWVMGTAASVRNDAGRIVSYLGAVVDVTALVTAKNDLEKKQTFIKILGFIKSNQIDSIKQYYPFGIDDTAGFNNRIQTANIIMGKSNSRIIMDSIFIADSSFVLSENKSFHDYCLRFYKGTACLGDIRMDFFANINNSVSVIRADIHLSETGMTNMINRINADVDSVVGNSK